MAATAPLRPSKFGAGQLFLADSRLAFAVLNELRYRALTHMFGVTRPQANVLTLVLAVGAGHTAVATAGRVVRAPLRITGGDVAMGGLAMRAAAVGVAGPTASEVTPFATLIGIAIAGGVAIPKLRRAAHRLRAAERRVRTL